MALEKVLTFYRGNIITLLVLKRYFNTKQVMYYNIIITENWKANLGLLYPIIG